MADRKSKPSKKQRTSWIPSFLVPQQPFFFARPLPEAPPTSAMHTQPMPLHLLHGRPFRGPPQEPPPPGHLLDIFKFTPFGIYCCVCCDCVASNERAIRDHLERKKHGYFSTDAIKALCATANTEVKKLSQQQNIGTFLAQRTGTPGFSCGCGTLFEEMRQVVRHCRKVKSCSFKREDAKPELLFRTVCGRQVTQSTLNRLALSVEQVDFEATERGLARYIRDDENIQSYVALFHPLVQRCGVNFDSDLVAMVDSWSKPVAEDEPDLRRVIEAGEKWILKSARFLVDMVPANLRALLQVFEGQLVGDVAHNTVFTFRVKEGPLAYELKLLLAFVWRQPGNLLLRHKHEVAGSSSDHPMLVPDILQVLLMEKVDDGFNAHPLVVEYCLARCFRKKFNRIEMPQAGDSASMVATVMSLLRAAACSYLIMSNMGDAAAKEFVCEARTGRVLNIVSPMIRRLRDLQRKKTSNRMLSVSALGDIAIDEFEIPRGSWSKAVPKVLEECRLLLAQLFADGNWSLFLPAETPITLSRMANRQFRFSVSVGGKNIASSELVLKESVTRHLTLDRLLSYIEICFHGFGGGSMRMTELSKLTLFDATWHRGTIYYSGESIKKFSHRNTSSSSMTNHKLPTAVARVFLLYRLASELSSNQLTEPEKSLLPFRSNRTYEMPNAISAVFNLEKVMSATQCRHIWTSVTNVLFPKGETVLVSADEEAAQMSGHTEGTHAHRYASTLVGGTELNFQKYHDGIGAPGVTNVSNAAIDQNDLSGALRNLFMSDTAVFTCPQQEEMVSMTSRRDGPHSHIGMPCGSGKCLSYLLPLVAADISFKEIGMMIVILPYNFLVSHLLHSARSIEQRFHLWIESFATSECRGNLLPTALRDDDKLPHLVFFGLDAFVALSREHPLSLRRWSEHGKIHRIFLDEVHTLFGEHFRDVYSHLPDIAKLGVPITTLSGTVPLLLVKDLCRHLNMASEDETSSEGLQVIHSMDLLGTFPSGFTISCNKSLDIEKAAQERVLEILLGAPPKFGIHLICATLDSANVLFKNLSSAYGTESAIKTRLVTSEVTREEQAETAGLWSGGGINILVSTSSALVGNENSQCRVVLIVGYLFNLMAVVQAMGRLRPKQRHSNGSIEMFVKPIFGSTAKFISSRDETSRNLLVAKGVVVPTPDQLRVFNKVGTTNGLFQWMWTTDGCRVVSLSACFGIESVAECRVCDRCRGTSVMTLASTTAKKVDEKVRVANKASIVFSEMKLKCLVCDLASCDGDASACIGRMNCFKCGEKHFVRNCDVDLNQMLKSRGCYGCLDLCDRIGYETHDQRAGCPLKKRLRRLIIEGWREERKTPTLTLLLFATRILCNPNTLNSFVVQFSESTSRKQGSTKKKAAKSGIITRNPYITRKPASATTR